MPKPAEEEEERVEAGLVEPGAPEADSELEPPVPEFEPAPEFQANEAEFTEAPESELVEVSGSEVPDPGDAREALR